MSETLAGNLHAAATCITKEHPGWDVVAMQFNGGYYTTVVYREEIPQKTVVVRGQRGGEGPGAGGEMGDPLTIVERYAMIPDAHHKQWVIDQMLRGLLGDGYERWRQKFDADAVVTDHSEWDEGIAP